MSTVYAEEKSHVLLLDTSENMRSSIDGQRKLDLLKMALSDFMQFWPKGDSLSVLSYRSHNECQGFDTQNSSSTTLTQVKFEQLSSIEANQNFPMLSALYRAKNQLVNQQGNIILIAAASNPCHKILSCEIAKQIKKNNPKIFIHTIDMQGNNSTLQCIAKLSGGKYLSIFDILQLSAVVEL
jgi:hypothetical protein